MDSSTSPLSITAYIRRSALISISATMSVASHPSARPRRARAPPRVETPGSPVRTLAHRSALSARMASAYIPRTSSNVVASSPDRDELGPPLAAASRWRARRAPRPPRSLASSLFSSPVPRLARDDRDEVVPPVSSGSPPRRTPRRARTSSTRRARRARSRESSSVARSRAADAREAAADGGW